MASLKVTVPPFIAKMLDDAGNIVPVWMAFFTRIAGLFPIDLTGSVTGVLPAANGGITPLSGTWIPVDGSGAALVLTVDSAIYLKLSDLVYVSTELVYPATADGSSARISGLPFTSMAAQSVLPCAQPGGPLTTQAAWVVRASSAVMDPFDMAGTRRTNAQVTGQRFLVSGIYRTAP